MFPDTSWLHSTGRLLIVAYFAMTLPHGILHGRASHHISKLRNFRVPFPTLAFWAGIAMEVIGCVLLLTGWHADIGLYFLIVFTVIANALYNRYWNHQNPTEQAFSRMLFGANTAVLGGLLVLLADVR